MLQIETLSLGAYQTNTYLVCEAGSSRCLIIDPGYEPETILAKLEALHWKPEAILLTHGHFDHVGGVQTIADATGCAVYMQEEDYCHPAILKLLYPLAGCKEPQVCFYDDGDRLCIAGLNVTVHYTPGHTPGCVCLQMENALFTGDTLFAGSCGRTDLPGGNGRMLMQSLQQLCALEEDFSVYPGHGPATTLNYERKTNPYMR